MALFNFDAKEGFVSLKPLTHASDQSICGVVAPRQVNLVQSNFSFKFWYKRWFLDMQGRKYKQVGK